MVVILDKKWVGKVIIVTGASSGIGEAISERLVEEGMKVVGLARRKERLDELSKKVSGKTGIFYGLKTDLSNEEDILNAFKWIKDNLGAVHAIVNNAGITKLGLFTESDTQNWIDVLQVNVIGLCIATRESIKIMREMNFDGHIININSMLGHRVLNLPGINMYPPSKHAILAINDVVRQELTALGSKIKVTSISPGMVNTEMIDEVSQKCEPIEKLKKKIEIMEPKTIAETVAFVLSTPSSVLITELMIRPLEELL